MSRRPLSLGVLLALVLSAPAAGHGHSAQFPTIAAAAGHDRRARHVERRVRKVETALLGAGHAAEHARQRSLAVATASRAAKLAPQEADNSLPPQTGGVWAPS